MENFQLYRTNILMGGQMKWDLILDNTNKGMIVSDLHLTPVSGNIPYTYSSDELLLNNSHEDNVKAYYRNMEGAFYSDGMSPEFNHNWPVIVPAGTRAYTYNSIYDMGCRRMKYYDLYGKQFEFFCPIWLEHLTGDLSFRFSVCDVTGMNIISQRVLTLKRDGVLDGFNKYFMDYVSRCGILDGTDDVMMIDVVNNMAYMTGLNAKTGIHTVNDISNITHILTSRERPLLEFDNIIVTNFSNKNVLVDQLFNLNFCFNLSDIMSGSLCDLVKGKRISVKVDVLVGNEVLELKDFDTEYKHIPKNIIYSDGSLKDKELDREPEISVTNYLVDHKCIDLVGVNKYSQQVCHWALCDNNDYIFNLYNGFSGFSISDKKIIQADHQYGKTPVLDATKHDDITNSVGWINIFNFNSWSEFYMFIMDMDAHRDEMCLFYDKVFVNDIKYESLPDKPIYFCGLYLPNELYIKVANNYEHINIGGKFIVIEYNDTILLVSDNLDTFTHRNILNMFHNMDTPKGLFGSFVRTFKSFITPSVITLSGSLVAERVDGPDYKTDEITYYKDNTHSEYVIRYDGKIKPRFTTIRTMYYKDYISDDRSKGKSKLQMSPYGKYSITGYEPLYGSIGYLSILSTKMNYVTPPIVRTSEFDKVPIMDGVEFGWFNNSTLVCIEPVHKFELIKTADDDLETMFRNYLAQRYGDTNVEYIRGLYNVSYDWDYVSPTNINEYRYNITMKLK